MSSTILVTNVLFTKAGYWLSDDDKDGYRLSDNDKADGWLILLLIDKTTCNAGLKLHSFLNR